MDLWTVTGDGMVRLDAEGGGQGEPGAEESAGSRDADEGGRPACRSGAPGSAAAVPPLEELPRERMLRAGARALSDAELLSVVLGTGTTGRSAVELARDILEEAGGLCGLRTFSLAGIARRGVGPAKACRVLATVEIATRTACRDRPRRLCLDRPEASARYLLLRYGRRDQEVMGAVYLNVRNQPVHEAEVFRGTLRRASVEPRSLLREAITVGAAGLLLFHTHPSGDPSPSVEDLAFTERMQRAAEVVGVRLVDHLILGDCNRWTSLRRLGALT